MEGFINLNKPFGITSHDCVAKLRRLLRLKRIGHAGTLDPAATGVLPIAVGKATRLLQYLQQDKAYRATIRFGISTTTDDLEGETIAKKPVPELTLEMVTAVIKQFEGIIQQIPPNYSAIQIDGKRLYDLARAGEIIDVPARTVEVYQIKILDWQAGEFPELEVAIACGAGTYIRAIARDLGIALQTGGTLATLIRTESSCFNLSDSLTFEQLELQLQQGTFHPLSPAEVLKHLPSVILPPVDAKRWCQGQKIMNLSSENREESQIMLQVYQENGGFLGIGQLVNSETGQMLIPQMVFEPF